MLQEAAASDTQHHVRQYSLRALPRLLRLPWRDTSLRFCASLQARNRLGALTLAAAVSCQGNSLELLDCLMGQCLCSDCRWASTLQQPLCSVHPSVPAAFTLCDPNPAH